MAVHVHAWAEHRFGLAEIQAMPALMLQRCPGRTWEWGLRPTHETLGSFGAQLGGRPNMITFRPGTLRIWDIARWLEYMDSHYWRATVRRRVLAIARALDVRELIWAPEIDIEYAGGGKVRSYAEIREELLLRCGHPQRRFEEVDSKLTKATTAEKYRAWHVETLEPRPPGRRRVVPMKRRQG